MKGAWTALFGVILLTSPALVDAQFGCSTNVGNTLTITNYTGPGGPVIIPANINGLVVKSIGTNAFYACRRLTSVTIPGSVTNIGEWAFYYCTNLASATIPGSVTSIGDYAFLRCITL